MEIVLAAVVAAAVAGFVVLAGMRARGAQPPAAALHASDDARRNGFEERERRLDERERKLEGRAEELERARQTQIRDLERLSGLSAGEAKQALLRELEDELGHERARVIRAVEDETKHDADRRVRSILATVMQRVASGHTVETTVSVVELKSDELKPG